MTQSSAEIADFKSIRDVIVTLIQGRGALPHGIGQELVADNLAYVAEKECATRTPLLDATTLRLLLVRDWDDDGFWRLILLNDEEILLEGDGELEAHNAMAGLFKSSAEWMQGYLHA